MVAGATDTIATSMLPYPSQRHVSFIYLFYYLFILTFIYPYFTLANTEFNCIQ